MHAHRSRHPALELTPAVEELSGLKMFGFQFKRLSVLHDQVTQNREIENLLGVERTKPEVKMTTSVIGKRDLGHSP
jgi:hypothetical protein